MNFISESDYRAELARIERENARLRHTITLLEKEVVGMEMELDCSCNAEKLRQAREENARLRDGLRKLGDDVAEYRAHAARLRDALANLLSVYDGTDKQEQAGQYARYAREILANATSDLPRSG